MDPSARLADRTGQLGEKSIPKLMAQFSMPSITAMVVSSTYNLINMSFIGRRVGSVGIAAIAICVPITLIQGALNQLIGNGCAAGVSIKLGAGDREGARQLMGSAQLTSNIISLMIMLFGHIYLDPILLAFGASEAILPYARDYLNILLFGSLFGSFSTMNPLMRTEGYPLRAMMTMLISTGVNLCLSPTFIFVFDLGIRGAAFATLCAQFSTAAWNFIFLVNKKRVVGLRWKYYRLDFRSIIRVVQLGLPTFLMQLVQSLLSFVMNKSLGLYGGDIAISSWGITNSIMNLISQPIFGLNQGSQPIIGFNIGAKNYGRVKKTMAFSLATAFCFSFLGWLATRLFPNQLFAFFNDDAELIRVGSHMITVYMMFLLVVGFQQAGAAYFQYAGKPAYAVLLTLSRQGFLLIPSLLILPRFFQMEGLLYAGPIADIGSALATGVCILFEVRRLNRLEREKREAEAAPARPAAESGLEQ